MEYQAISDYRELDKARERQAIKTIQDIINDLGEVSHIKAAMEGVLEIAIRNIEDNAMWSLKKELELSKMRNVELEKQLQKPLWEEFVEAKMKFAIRVLEGNRVTPEETILMAEMIKTGAFNKRVMGLEKLSNAHCGDKIETQHWINPVLHP